jgi:threonyl-tRNA synthetase
LDFVLAKKFALNYINEDNKKQTPIIIHRSLIGTYERFVSILLEQNQGKLPF